MAEGLQRPVAPDARGRCWGPRSDPGSGVSAAVAREGEALPEDGGALPDTKLSESHGPPRAPLQLQLRPHGGNINKNPRRVT